MSGETALGPALAFDVSGLGTIVLGLPERLAARLATTWEPFLGATGTPFARFSVSADPPCPDDPSFSAKAMQVAFEGAAVRFAMREGWAEVLPGNDVRVHLAATTENKQYYAFVNLALAAFAWKLPARTGLVLHAAAIVLDERAFLLVGAEGAGKTTWARIAREHGARVLGDDVVLVDFGARGFEAIASPFRAEECGAIVPGRWPIGAILGSRHATAPALEDDAPVVVRARLHANVPYAIDGIGRHEALAATLDRLAAEAAHRRLAWRPDGSFLDLLRAS